MQIQIIKVVEKFGFLVLSLFTIYQWTNGLCSAASGEYGMCLPESDCVSKRGILGGPCALGYGICCVCKLLDFRKNVKIQYCNKMSASNYSYGLLWRDSTRERNIFRKSKSSESSKINFTFSSISCSCLQMLDLSKRNRLILSLLLMFFVFEST